jgi:hypothetical protein
MMRLPGPVGLVTDGRNGRLGDDAAEAIRDRLRVSTT